MNSTASKKSRLTEWWRPKAGAIFSLLLFYLALWNVPFEIAWKLLLFSVVTLTGFGLTGYFLNDWADIPFDKKVGKTNLVASVPVFARPLILLGLLVLTLIPWFVYFETDALSVGLIIAQFLLQFAYPIPPIRLKNYPIPAMITDSLYAFLIPAVLAWHTFDITSGYNDDQLQNLHFVFLSIWMLAMGVRHIINHHMEDRHNDFRTETPNLTSVVHPVVLRKFVQRFLFPLELISSIAFFSVLLVHAGFLPLLAIIFLTGLAAGQLMSSPPFFLVSFSKTRLDKFSSFYLGLLGILVLCIHELEYLIVLMLFLALFTDLPSHPLAKHSFGRIGYYLFDRPKKLASLTANWSIYYLRKYLLGWTDERNFGVHYQDHLARSEVQARKQKGIVAIFNQNHNKYTETFVRGHVEQLPLHVVFFHGWPAPVFTGNMENIMASNDFIFRLRYHIAYFLNIDTRKMEDRYIVKRLLTEKVDVILAEFGTMGVRMVSVAEELGIPIIPIFYGYDAWHNQTINENKDAYQTLFEVAPLVLGVSEDICAQLVKLGCPKSQVEYLPCYLDLAEFEYIDRDFSEPNYLAIGRFCATKAPFLTILAFSKVVKQIPDAKLTMIGGDENGVLETCRSLIKALDLQNHISLPGTQTSSQIRDQMAKASIFVQHSVTTPQTGDKEGTPVAIMEAMATGLPVVSTKHAGIAEIIDNGVTGILVNEFDIESMATEMIRVYSDKEKMRRMGKAASEAIFSNRLLTDHIVILTSKLEKHIKR